MHRTAWDRDLTPATSPKFYGIWKLSPYGTSPIPLSHLKRFSLVPTSCVPIDKFPYSLTDPFSDGTTSVCKKDPVRSYQGEAPLLREAGSNETMTLKLTQSGVVFLGKLDSGTGKYEETGRFRSRYVGSSKCTVDFSGRLWLEAAELKDEVQRDKKERDPVKAKKKAVGSHPASQMTSVDNVATSGAISEESSTTANLAAENAKKVRIKSYKVDKAKVRHRIYNYINTERGKKRLFFWTVTFPEHTPDDVCYKAFNTWLTSLRQYKMLKDYLWIAERQEGERLKKKKEPTHTLHFHIAIPHYLNVQRANAMMRGTLKNLAKQGFIPGGMVCNTKTKESYFTSCVAKYNGVHISKHKKTNKPINFAVKKGAKSLADYLTKYVTKNDAGQKNEKGELIAPGFTHLAWHNSRGFSCLFTGITCTVAEFIKSGHGKYLFRKRVLHSNFSVFIPWDGEPPPAFKKHLYEVNSFIHELIDEQDSIIQT